MLIYHIALVTELESISCSQLTRVAAALQKQVLRDFAPIWRINATVDAFCNLDDVPIGYWPVVVMENIGYEGAAGIHLDEDGQPFALVEHNDNWELTSSHEVLEMLADPFGNRLAAGPSIKPGQGRVEYLVEVCDPSEEIRFGYTVNGITVSDFYFPSFFDPVPIGGTSYSFTGAIPKPRTVLRGGYLSWRDPRTGIWWQQTFFGSKKQFHRLGVFSARHESLRAEVDKRTFRPERSVKAKGGRRRVTAAAAFHRTVSPSTNARATSLRKQIDVIARAARPKGRGKTRTK